MKKYVFLTVYKAVQSRQDRLDLQNPERAFLRKKSVSQFPASLNSTEMIKTPENAESARRKSDDETSSKKRAKKIKGRIWENDAYFLNSIITCLK